MHRFLSITLRLTLFLVFFSACGSETSQVQPPPGPPTPPGTPPPQVKTDAPPLNAEIFPAPGATEFTSANEKEMLSSGTQNGGWDRGDYGIARLDANEGGSGKTAPPA